MRTDERDAQGRQGPNGFRLIKHVAIVLAVAVLAWMFLCPADTGSGRGYERRDRANITQCINNLKSMGLCINNYFSDGTSAAMPILKRYEVDIHNDGVFHFYVIDIHNGFHIDDSMLSCQAERLGGSSKHYVWNPKLSGGRWVDWNNPNSPLIWDALPHKRTGKAGVLFGDGHVEEMTPERLKELTK